MSPRTSSSHPLQIATIVAGDAMGAVGVTLCPGKNDADAATGAWDRGLAADLDAIADWNAAAIITLMEDHELAALAVEGLGRAVQARHMTWFHLPIRDVDIPGERFEEGWRHDGEAIRALVRAGANVVLHCRGGLGRSGMIAARLLTELGWAPDKAIAAIRHVRPGAIETRSQEQVVVAARLIPPRPVDRSPEAVADRARGCLLGLALGDALGTTLEFAARDAHPKVTDLVGGGHFGLKPGEWTDDTAMALALAESLHDADGLDERDLMRRFVAWYREGRYSCTGTCFDIGVTTRQALEQFRRDGDPIAGSTDPRAAGNGSLMRLAPVALRFRGDRMALIDAARRQSRITHAADEAVDACAAFAELLAEAIDGAGRDQVLAPRPSDHQPSIASILAGSWRAKTRAGIPSSGYVVHTLEAALWCVARTTSFRDAVVLAANLGDDADTVGAVTGQLAGALWGAGSMPAAWLDALAWRHEIERLADQLVSASGLPR